MSGRAILGFTTGALLIASSWAHAFLGWPALLEALASQAVEPELIGALAVGWYFGSVAMLVFGLIVVLAAIDLMRRNPVARGPLQVIAIGYLVFGATAFLSRDLNPHFLVFVVTGLLVGVLANWRPGSTPSRAQEPPVPSAISSQTSR